MIKNILFDLDGTLINTAQDEFNQKYFESLILKFAKQGYDSQLLTTAVIEGLFVMLQNDGKKTNEDVFWDNFENKTKIKKEIILPTFNDFHNNEYENLNTCIKAIDITGKAIDILRNKGYNLILSTNPLFPKIAIEKRMKWGNIDPNYFSYITTYENSSYCKPNINYYKQILENNNLNLEETFMFGNDLIEDLAIENLGITCYIITNNVVNIDNIKNCTRKGDYNEFLQFINNLPKIN